MLCLRLPAIYILWSVCRDASRLQHLTASFDSFVARLRMIMFRPGLIRCDGMTRHTQASTDPEVRVSSLVITPQPV